VSGPELALVVSVFLACAVEAVEALTIVLAVGSARSWSSSLYGCAAAAVALAVVVAAFGPALTQLPVDTLRLVVGALLLIFGLQWLRKAILRAAHLKALRDENAAFARERAAARAADERAVAGVDLYALVVSFKGVLLEGLEVAVIVLTFGANQHRVALAAAAALAAIALVALAGLAARAPLARVPENAMKLAVGVMLTSFGTFWGAQGAGASWPGDDAALLAIIPGVALASLMLTLRLRRRAQHAAPASEAAVVTAEVN
jgi:uncharacterized membrane protein